MKKDKKKEPIGVAIRKLLGDVFKEYKTEKMDKLLNDKFIKATFVNYGASGLPGYPPFSAFQKLLHPLLEQLVPIASDLVERIYYLLEKTI